jgi:hypothetical protein
MSYFMLLMNFLFADLYRYIALQYIAWSPTASCRRDCTSECDRTENRRCERRSHCCRVNCEINEPPWPSAARPSRNIGPMQKPHERAQDAAITANE